MTQIPVTPYLRCTAKFTELEQPVSFLDNAADASGIHIPHKLPEQRTERRLGCHQLFHARNANTYGLLGWSVLEQVIDCRLISFIHYRHVNIELICQSFNDSYFNIVYFFNGLRIFAGCS